MSATGSLTAAVSAEVNTRSSQIAGVHAQLVFKTTATRSDGKKVFGGIGLASTAPSDLSGGQSEILLQADRLVFVPSSDPNAPLKNLMEVGLVDGVTSLRIPAAIIGDLTIGNSKILGDLRAEKIVAGTLGAAVVHAGSLSAVTGTLGQLTIAADGHIRQGQSSFDTGTGFYLGDNGSGTPVFSVGDSTKGISWNGSAFAVRGQVVGASNLLVGAASAIGFAAVLAGQPVTLQGPNFTGEATGSEIIYAYACSTAGVSVANADKTLLLFSWDYTQSGGSGSRVFVEVTRTINSGPPVVLWANAVATTGTGRVGGQFPISSQALSTGVSGAVSYGIRFKMMDYITQVVVNSASIAAVLLKNSA